MTPGQAGILAGAYLVSGIIFSCDLDLRSEPYLRWGRFRFIWWPYQRILHHRAVWSHGLVIGPVLRIVYFVVMMFALMFLGLSLVNVFQPVDPTGTSLRAARWLRLYHPPQRRAGPGPRRLHPRRGQPLHRRLISTGHKRLRRRHPFLRRFL